jgi:hypothetical protein
MISGRQALTSIDQALNEERTKLEEVERRIEALSAGLVERQQADARDYRELAKVRVDLLADGELLRHIDQAERQVLTLLKSRESAAEELSRHIRAAEETHKALETERANQAEAVDRAAEVVDEAEARTQARLDAQADYQVQRERAREAERTVMPAQEKVAHSEQERDHKGESYRGDTLFMYLWERNYGLPEYDANALIRWLDGSQPIRETRILRRSAESKLMNNLP